jgi:hypothetical protein
VAGGELVAHPSETSAASRSAVASSRIASTLGSTDIQLVAVAGRGSSEGVDFVLPFFELRARAGHDVCGHPYQRAVRHSVG